MTSLWLSLRPPDGSACAPFRGEAISLRLLVKRRAMDIPEHDVIIVGAGNAATCAALSARENGASVLQLEISPEAARGGNSASTGGAFRVVYHGFDDLAQLIPDINDNELQNVDVGTYTAEQYFDDIGRLTEYRCDPDLSELLINTKLRH